MTPQISIIIPAFNASRFLAKTLDSVSAQSFQNFQCLIVNDGSSDQTPAIAAAHAAADPRFQLLSQPNAGHGAAKNAGFHASNPLAPFVIFMDADDLWLPHALLTLHQALLAAPDALAAHALADEIDPGDHPLNPGSFINFGRNRVGLDARLQPAPLPLHAPTTFDVIAFEDRIFPSGTILYRRQPLAASGLFDTSLDQHEDTHLHLRLAATGHFAFAPEILVLYRRHPHNWSKRTKHAARAYWTMRKNLAPTLSPQHRQILTRTSQLFQRRKTSMWFSAANHDLSKGHLKKAASCYAHFALNACRTLRVQLTGSC